MGAVIPPRSIIRKNSTGSEYIRRRINLIEGTNVTLTVADDSTDEEIDVTIAATGSSSGSNGIAPTTAFTTLSSTFTAAANSNEQTVTGLSTTISSVSFASKVLIMCQLELDSKAGNNDIRLKVNGTTCASWYSGASGTEKQVHLSSIVNVSANTQIDITLTVQNSSSNQIVVYGTSNRSQITAVLFSQ